MESIHTAWQELWRKFIWSSTGGAQKAHVQKEMAMACTFKVGGKIKMLPGK